MRLSKMALQIIKLQNLTDYKKGTTINVGKIYGGSKINVVPDYAQAEIDVRVRSEKEVEKVQRVSDMTPNLERARITVEGDSTVLYRKRRRKPKAFSKVQRR
jgi:glutamate carboxypeptidase